MWQYALVPCQNVSELSYFNMRQIQANQLVSARPLAVFLKIEFILPCILPVFTNIFRFFWPSCPPTNSTPLENPLRGPRVKNALAHWDCRYMVYPIASHLNVGYDDHPLGSNWIGIRFSELQNKPLGPGWLWHTLHHPMAKQDRNQGRLLRPDVPYGWEPHHITPWSSHETCFSFTF
jgi:hypothetical protein